MIMKETFFKNLEEYQTPVIKEIFLSTEQPILTISGSDDEIGFEFGGYGDETSLE